MPVKYIGELSGSVLVFGGPYSNLEASLAIKKRAQQLDIPPSNCICTGDIVAYCANPVETLSEIRNWGIHSIQGNCEESLANDATDCGCGFGEGSICDTLSKQWFDYSTNALSANDKLWMGSLPKQLSFDLNGKRFHVVHGGTDDISRFIFNSTPISTYLYQLSKIDCDVVIAGHCGLPFTKYVGDKVWHNAGVIGMPANDATSDVWYSLITPQLNNKGVEISHHRLSYGAKKVADAMKVVGLAEDYIGALTSGLWPSLDILPDAERQQTGIALDELTHIV